MLVATFGTFLVQQLPVICVLLHNPPNQQPLTQQHDQATTKATTEPQPPNQHRNSRKAQAPHTCQSVLVNKVCGSMLSPNPQHTMKNHPNRRKQMPAKWTPTKQTLTLEMIQSQRVAPEPHTCYGGCGYYKVMNLNQHHMSQPKPNNK
ncbi:hypothetical protein BS47DRAFT_1362445 [Hydnum rufescens UP504]|uniref:Secreted protein n=1 Tax=Hydnum rufescens UP504 TaxID=1448309 RepID=A0A9P6AXE7_9AGAM|nr:hypothetical protein BS47DRAFT_1362445 [Hydnum rufescens UP504]